MRNDNSMDTMRNKFFGRERIMRDIVLGTLASRPSSFSLVGSKLCGKSKIIAFLASDHGPFCSPDMEEWRPAQFVDGGRILPVLIDCDWQEAQDNLLQHVYAVLSQLVKEKERINLTWSDIEGQPAIGRRIWQIARQLNDMDYRLVLLFDNFDSVFERQLISVDAVDELRPLTMELAMVVATEQPLHDLDRNLAASPLFNVMTQVFIGLLDPEAALSWIDLYAETYPQAAELKESLLDITGAHPYLLRRIGDIFAEMRPMFPPESDARNDLFPFVRMRLAEHGRLLFTRLWQKLQAPPPPVQNEALIDLLSRLVKAPLAISEIGREHFATANWLINQAILRVSVEGYHIFSPLFAEFMASRIQSSSSKIIKSPAALRAGQADIYRRLTKIETSLLRYFEENSNQVISPEQLLAEVWKRPDASTRRVQEAIRRLRLQLEDEDPIYGVIENDRGRGYRFVPS